MAPVERVPQESFKYEITEMTVAAGRVYCRLAAGRTNPSISQPKGYITPPRNNGIEISGTSTYYRHNKPQQLYPPARRAIACVPSISRDFRRATF
jgi:hypothetical protein